MATNKQQQEEELLILKSILAETITDLSKENDQFEIDIDFQLPTPFYLRLLNDSNQISTLIEHLPPLVLSVYFHDQYPSSIHSPTFVLSSCYLSADYLQSMCSKLDDIWEQNLSEPIVYQWIEALKEHFLSTTELCLSSTDSTTNHDEPRAMSSYEGNRAAHVYDQIIAYNQEKEHEKFLQEYHECSICLSNNIPGREMVRFHKCHHVFCRSCLHDYAIMHINTGSVEWVLCPDLQCQLALLPSEIKDVVRNDQLYEKYERLLLQKTLEHMLDIFWCPRCQHAVLTGSENDKLAFCDHCRYAFCKRCKKGYHSQALCDFEFAEVERLRKRQLIQQRLQALNLSDDDQSKLFKEFFAQATIENSTRLCPNPSCRVPIEKNEGCNHMHCTRCQRSFNWNDAKIQSTDTRALLEEYDHDADKVREAFNDDKLDITPAITKLFVQRAGKCPNEACGKLVIRYGNGNYGICEHCKRGFCHSCGLSVIDPKVHFQNGCQRHSVY